MGKQRKKKFKSPPIDSAKVDTPLHDNPFSLSQIGGNVFQGIDINVDKLKTTLPADLQSVKSLKSRKSEAGKILPKRAKLKLHREALMQKLSVLTPRRGAKSRNKKKKKKEETKSPMADLSGLNDALLSSLKPETDAGNVEKTSAPKKKKGVEKASKQKRRRIEGIKMFQHVYKNKQFKSDARNIIAQHLQTVIVEKK